MLGQRLRCARLRAGMTQIEMGAALDLTGSHMTKVETGVSGLRWRTLAAAAHLLNVSVDWLVGLTEDPMSARERLDSGCPVDFVPVHISAAVAGVAESTIYAMESGIIPFRRSWMEQQAIDWNQAAVFRIHGDSMDPTLPHGSAILVDYARTQLRDGGLFVFRIGDCWLVKRARYSGEWRFVSENPYYSQIPFEDDTVVIGEVKWCGRTF